MSGPWAEEPWWPTAELDAAKLLRTLVEHDVDFLVIGGLAVMFHGYVRATKDLDVVPDPDPANTPRLFEALDRLEAEPIGVGDFRPEELPVRWGPDALDAGGNWVLLTTAGRIDVIQSLAGIEGWNELHLHAVEADLGGIGRVRFASYEDLVKMKRVADRPPDRIDLDRLARIHEDPSS